MRTAVGLTVVITSGTLRFDSLTKASHRPEVHRPQLPTTIDGLLIGAAS
ncbi:hypothetical protein [Arthrobacter sp. MMS18-M83]|nr:hypothetical protein [Arthrobacter sp. MMS18-M83]WAH97495.1 hypothetical protein OW521_00910 [Arthrobacter sp. MMS18-M83]